MPARAIPANLQTSLSSEVIQLCVCVKIVRQDTTILGFTTYDRDVVLDGITYQAASAIQASNIRQEVGGNPDNLDVVGILSSDSITETDLRAGRYDNATVDVFICDWANPAYGSVNIMRGNIGDVTITDGMYTAGVRSLMQRFQQQVGELVSPTCRVFELGDSRCKFDLTGNTVGGSPARSNGTVTSVDDPLVLNLSGIVNTVGYYNYGTLKSTNGLNNGYIREIKLHSSISGLTSTTISPTNIPSGNLSFKRSYDFTPSLNCVFSIPAGIWENAYAIIQSHWVIISAGSPGTDQLTFQFPPGQANDLLVRSNSIDATTYNDTLNFGNVILGLINAAAGGSMTMALRHTVPSSAAPHYFDVDVPSIQLTLIGPGSGTSNRIVLHEAFPFTVNTSDTFQITTGCNRLASTCTQKFNNITNFRGEPHLPGTSKLLERGRPPQ